MWMIAVAFSFGLSNAGSFVGGSGVSAVSAAQFKENTAEGSADFVDISGMVNDKLTKPSQGFRGVGNTDKVDLSKAAPDFLGNDQVQLLKSVTGEYETNVDVALRGGISSALASDALPNQVVIESKVKLSDEDILADNPELAGFFMVLDVSDIPVVHFIVSIVQN